MLLQGGVILKKGFIFIIIGTVLAALLMGCSQENNPVKITNPMDRAISHYILKYNKNTYLKTDKQFEAHKLYGASKYGKGVIDVYIYSVYEGFDKDSKSKVKSGGSLPALVKLKKVGDQYKVIGYKESDDGTGWTPSIKKMFPPKYANEAIMGTGTRALQHQIDKKVNEWLKDTR